MILLVVVVVLCFFLVGGSCCLQMVPHFPHASFSFLDFASLMGTNMSQTTAWDDFLPPLSMFFWAVW